MNSKISSEVISLFSSLGTLAKQYNEKIENFQSTSQLSNISDDISFKVQKQIKHFLSIFPENPIVDVPRSEQNIVESFLKLSNLRIDSNFTKEIDENDIVEIYDFEGNQIFRNLVFCKYCNYDLVTLYTRPFYELYSRDKIYDKQIIDFFQEVEKNVTSTVRFAVEPHYIRESLIKSHSSFKVHPKWASPVWDENDNKVGLIISNYCKEYSIRLVQ